MGLPNPKFIFATALTAFCSSIPWGYHMCVINVPEQIFKDFINESAQARYGMEMDSDRLTLLYSWTVSIYSVGGVIGAAITPIFAERLGRKSSLIIWSNVASIVSGVMMALCQVTQSLELLMAGRFIVGIVAGLTVCLLPVYLSECSPPEYRGLMGSFQNFCFNFATLLSFCISAPQLLGHAKYLPILLGFGIVPSVIQLISSFFLHESPKYLYIKKKDPVAAEKSLKFWSPSSDPVNVKEKFEEFSKEAEALSQEVGLVGAMKIPYFRRIMFVTVVLMVCQAGTGAPAVYSYSTQLFQEIGLNLQVASVSTEFIAVVSTCAALFMTPFIEKFSRRSLFFSSNVLLLITLLTYSIPAILVTKLHAVWMKYVAAGSLFAYAFLFNVGPGPLSFIIPPEMAPQAIRSTVNSVGWTTSWILSLVVTAIYPLADNKMGPYSFFLFIPLSVLALVYLYKAMPETSGQTVADIVRKNSSPQQPLAQVQVTRK